MADKDNVLGAANMVGGILGGLAALSGNPHPANVAGGILAGSTLGHMTVLGVREKRASRREHLEAGIRGARNEPSFEEQANWANDMGSRSAKRTNG